MRQWLSQASHLASILKAVGVAAIAVAIFYITSIANTAATSTVKVHNVEPEAHHKAETKHDDDPLAHEQMREAQKEFFTDQTTLILDAISEIER